MREYTTERGATLGIIPIPLLLGKIREAHPMPPAPTYTEHLAGGAEQNVPITEKMAAVAARDNPEWWEGHKAAWAEYEAQLEARTEKLNDALWSAILRRAIVVELPTDGAWEEEMALFGIDVPAEQKARQAVYVWTDCMGGAVDLIRIMAIASGGDLTEEQVAAALASFRDTLARPAAGKPAAEARPVEPGDAGSSDSDGQDLGQEAE